MVLIGYASKHNDKISTKPHDPQQTYFF